MKSDLNGCSTAMAGEEKFEYFNIKIRGERQSRLQYDYRTPGGKLFSCVARDLKEARVRRDAWLDQMS